MTNSTATPNLMTDPGYLFWAPAATAAPANTVVGSVFTDTWPVAWINLGATEAGNTIGYQLQVQPRSAAEFLDPIQQATVSRDGSIAFNLLNFTLTNMKKVMNGGSLTVVSGTGTTQLNTYTPPLPGQEVRCMIGWESLDATVRFIAYQTINATQVNIANAKSPAMAALPTQFHFEVPSSGIPFQFWSAGTVRA
jgi:hypothetical protein